ncbi:MAG: hypothetical protein R3E41_03140 [Burkholderiaceae bacterium]|jgi:hypothetical protein|nr:hypothetical protein [Burkholderiaceae bacterium]
MGSFSVALLEALVSAGVAPDRARAVVDLFDRSVDERYSLHAEVLATKRDVAMLQSATTRAIADLEIRLTRDLAENRASIAETNSRIAETHSRIAEAKVDLVKWGLAALTAQTALILGATKLL